MIKRLISFLAGMEPARCNDPLRSHPRPSRLVRRAKKILRRRGHTGDGPDHCAVGGLPVSSPETLSMPWLRPAVPGDPPQPDESTSPEALP